MFVSEGAGRNPFYYLQNFESMLEILQRRDGDLLAADEVDFMAEFRRLDCVARAILVRMAMRKGPLFRLDRLVYAEVPDVVVALAPLIELGWVDARPRVTLDELFRVLTKAGVSRFFSRPRRPAPASKAALLEDLRARLPVDCELDAGLATAGEAFVRFAAAGLCNRLRFMFFGNFRQELHEFILADMGVFKYERIEVHAESRPFRTRHDVEAFHRLFRCRELLEQGAPLGDVVAQLPSPIDNEWLQDRREKLRFRIGREFERVGDVDEALQFYADCSHPDAAARLLRLRDKAAGTPRRVRCPASKPPEFTLNIPAATDGRTVEQLVLDHLADASEGGTEVHFVENALINSLFGLLFWTAIFAPVRGAFFHDFHAAPADLLSAGFCARREVEFARCFEEFRLGTYKDTIRRHWTEKQGVASAFVAWGLVNDALLTRALDCFPAEHLERWFAWILRDLRGNRTGFPDLVQFWPESRRYRLVEVKGPGDRLQDNQRRCFAYCLAHDMPVWVCHVRWIEPTAVAGREAARLGSNGRA